MKILITDGENRSALAVTRSLGRRGYDVFVAGVETANISACSKFCKANFQTPNPMKNGRKYSERIMDIVLKEKIDVVLPVTEQSIYLLNSVRDEFPRDVILACSPSEHMDAVSNKYRLFQMAEKAGIPVPETVYVNGVEDFQDKQSRISIFPVVVKPAFSKILSGDEIISAGVMYAADRCQLEKLYDKKPVLNYPSLVQEMIVGEGTGLFTLFDVDHHLVLFSHRRLLEKPPSGGISVISESIPLDPEMVISAEKLLCAVGWQGVAMVEFKRDRRDERAKLIEINGRFWGSLQLAIAAGVDFPALCLDYYLGKKPASLLADFSLGHRLKWFCGIVDHLAIRLKKGPNMLGLPPDSPTRWQVACELLKTSDAKTSFDVYDLQDLGPFVAEIKGYLTDLFRLR